MISTIRRDLLEVLGDEYISQHIFQSYRDYLAETSYKVYVTNILRGLASMVSGKEVESSYYDILQDLDNSVKPAKRAESEQEIKTRILTKLNGKEEDKFG